MCTSVSHRLSGFNHRAAHLGAACLFSAALCASTLLAAQAPSSPPPSKPAVKTVRPHKRPGIAPSPAAPAVPVDVTPPAPEMPHWPANDEPKPASIVWDSQGLRIDAANSSLEEILKDVSTVTGAKVEGLSSDERVFGAYGPGKARDVLAQLLQGSSYNVIMIGDQGQGAPRQILLSTRHSGEAQSAAKQNTAPDEDADVEEPPQQQPPQQPGMPGRPNFTPGAPPRSPQQIMQEMQQRQQDIQRQQQLQAPAPQN